MERKTQMNRLVLKGRKVVGGAAEGEALVTRQNISTWGGVDALRGVITERRHELRGQFFTGKILVFPSAKGSSGWSTVTQVIRLAGKAPKAMIIREINSLTGIGSVIMGVPTITDLNKDPTEVISTGDWVRMDADKGIVEVTKKGGISRLKKSKGFEKP
jgi:predicted aconitase with swiveling domain